MAKYRHRIFEMYELRDEATRVLMPKSASPATEATAPESWTFQHLAVSRSAGVTHVQFKEEFREAQASGEDTVGGLREDFKQLAGKLDRNSKVLLDFTGVESFGSASIDALTQLNRQLQNKGSRIVLCSLGPAARECFFVTRSP